MESGQEFKILSKYDFHLGCPFCGASFLMATYPYKSLLGSHNNPNWRIYQYTCGFECIVDDTAMGTGRNPKVITICAPHVAGARSPICDTILIDDSPKFWVTEDQIRPLKLR